MAQMKYTTFEELEDKYLGKIGTPGRDAYETENGTMRVRRLKNTIS